EECVGTGESVGVRSSPYSLRQYHQGESEKGPSYIRADRCAYPAPRIQPQGVPAMPAPNCEALTPKIRDSYLNDALDHSGGSLIDTITYDGLDVVTSESSTANG